VDLDLVVWGEEGRFKEWRWLIWVAHVCLWQEEEERNGRVGYPAGRCPRVERRA
jgi:hypothetical protein